MSALDAVSPAMKMLALYGELLQQTALERLDEVINIVTHALQLAEESGVHLWDNLFVGMAVHIALQRGNTGLAQDYLVKMERLLDEAMGCKLLLYAYGLVRSDK